MKEQLEVTCRKEGLGNLRRKTDAQANVNKAAEKKNVTLPHTLERQELLSNAKGHGAVFPATGGGHLTSDDFFKSMEVPKRRQEVKAMEEDKKLRLKMQNCKEEAKTILALNKQI